jgi:shikimate kinase
MQFKNKNLKNIFLIGFMGAGKTSVGRALAKKLGLDFRDLDEMIKKELGMTIPDIFSTFGEDFFRNEESKALRSVARAENQVIATGGGVVLREENWETMKKDGITIYLKASAEVLWSRVKSNTSRPLLQVGNPFEKLQELLFKRVSLYERADLIISTENISPGDVAEKIIRELDGY